MKNLFEFFESFNEREISIADLAEKLSVSLESLSLFLGDYDNYKSFQSFVEQYHVHVEWYTPSGEKLEHRFIRGADFTNIGKAEKIFNRYYTNPERQMDLILSEYCFGYHPYKGQIDKSDIGGLYSSAWLTDEYTEVPFYINDKQVDILINHFPQNKWAIEFRDGKFKVETKFENLSCESTHHKLNMAVGLVLKDWVKLQPILKVVQMCFSSGHYETISPVFYTQAEAEIFLNKQEPMTSESGKYQIKDLK